MTTYFAVKFDPMSCQEEPWIIKDCEGDEVCSYGNREDADSEADRLNCEHTVRELREAMIEKLDELENSDVATDLVKLQACLEILS